MPVVLSGYKKYEPYFDAPKLMASIFSSGKRVFTVNEKLMEILFQYQHSVQLYHVYRVSKKLLVEKKLAVFIYFIY